MPSNPTPALGMPSAYLSALFQLLAWALLKGDNYGHFRFERFFIIGAIAGWLAGKIMKGDGFGLLGNMGVCIVGAAILLYLVGVLKRA